MKYDPFDTNRAAAKKAQRTKGPDVSHSEAKAAAAAVYKTNSARLARRSAMKMADGGMVNTQQRRDSGRALDKIEFDADTNMLNAQVRRANADASRNYKMALLAKARTPQPTTQEDLLSSITRKAKGFFAADGGMVEGPGGPTDDVIPAMYSAGEYVLPADTVKAVGKENLDTLRRMTHTKKHKSKVKDGVIYAASGGAFSYKMDNDRKREEEEARNAAAQSTGVLAPVAGAATAGGIAKRLATGGSVYSLPGALKPVEPVRDNPYNKGGFSLANPNGPAFDDADVGDPAKTLEYNGPNLIDDTPRNITASQGNARDSSNVTEAERKSQLSGIDSQLFQLGSLNMASKRRAATDLLGLKRQLTADRMGQLGDADKLATGVSSDNAQMRQGADQFNTGTALDVEKFNTGARNEYGDSLRRSQAEMAKIAAANDPNSLDNRLRIAANARAENADLRAGDAFNLGREGMIGKDAEADIAARMKASPGMTREQAAAERSAALQTAGRPDTNSVAGIEGATALRKRSDAVLNSDAARPVSLSPIEAGINAFDNTQVNNVDPEQVAIDREYTFSQDGVTGLAKRLGNAFGMDNRTVKAYSPTDNGAKTSFLTEAEAREFEREKEERARNRQLARRAKQGGN